MICASRRLVTLWSLTSALAGFLFGFDTVVISGAEQTIQALWHLTDGMQGIAIGSALYGTVFGSLLGGFLTDRLGRRTTLMFIGLHYLLGAIGSATAHNVDSFILFRFLGGLGIGVSTIAAPLFIAEIAPAERRGRLGGLFQFNIVFGILFAYFSNALLAGSGPQAWRWMLGVAAFPSLAYTLLCLGLPESPRWLLTRRQDLDGAHRVLRLIRPQQSEMQLQADIAAICEEGSAPKARGRLFVWPLRTPIAMAFLISYQESMRFCISRPGSLL